MLQGTLLELNWSLQPFFTKGIDYDHSVLIRVGLIFNSVFDSDVLYVVQESRQEFDYLS